jgi:hypothetical protein
MHTNNEPAQTDLFVEQAEYLEDDQFLRWTVQHPEEETIIKRLTQSGAKLITGPRGCGKTTLLLKAHRTLRSAHGQQALPIYVNFKTSLRLEPYYKASANGSYLFQQWLVLKIYGGLFDELNELSADTSLVSVPRDVIKSRTEALEGGGVDPASLSIVSPTTLENDIDRVLGQVSRKRCVLLLDDAAHAFSAEQQRDFFEFFRAIKSKTIAPKAAIYPGVTTFSPTFHVGHDAEEIDVWLRPDSEKYLPFMKQLLHQRLTAEIWNVLEQQQDLLDLLAYSAFGVPRALLNMIRSIATDGGSGAAHLDFTRIAALKTVRNSHAATTSIFSSLSKKLPMYEKFILTGRLIFDRATSAIKGHNKGRDAGAQSTTIGVKQPIPPELAKVFAFFQYAGLISPRGDISQGGSGVFDLYAIHYAALISKNALFGDKAINPSKYNEAFRRRNPREFPRLTARVLLDNQEIAEALPLSLPPCQVCKVPRVSEAAKFCLNCGSPLLAMSTFETLIANDIQELPLTSARVRSIKQHSALRTVKDILLDHEHRQLRGIPQIGPAWAKRIYSYAEEYLA